MSLIFSFTRGSDAATLAGVRPHPWVAGSYYDVTTMIGATVNGIITLTADTLYATPFWVGPGGFDADRIALFITTGSSACRLGIYTHHATAFRPDALVLDASTVDTSTTGLKEITIDVTLPSAGNKNLYWLAVVSNGTPALRSGNGGISLFGVRTADGNSYMGQQMSHTYGALPSSFSSSPTSNISSPRIMLRNG